MVRVQELDISYYIGQGQEEGFPLRGMPTPDLKGTPRI